tara:strand:- start:745 stop:2835 length:2091 start_codon:yes stop_codon:yes gene_type:complete
MELNKINEEAFKKELVRIVDEHENGGSELEDLDNYNYVQITDGLSRWALQDILDEPDPKEQNKKLVDRSRNKKTGNIGEFGCDIFENEALITVGQTKYHEKFGESIPITDIEKMENTIKDLKKFKVVKDKTIYGPLDENDEPLGSEKFQDAAKAFIDEDNKTKKIIFITTGKLKGPQVCSKWDELKKNYPKYRFEMYDIERILRIALDPKTPNVELKFNQNEWYEKTDPITKKKSRSGIVNAKDLEIIISKNDDVIFNWNPRKQLGRSSVTFGSISKTLEDKNEKKQFYKLSNGITAVCERIEVITEEILDQETGLLEEVTSKIKIENLKITNGRQSTFALQEFQAITQNNLDDVEVEIRIHEVKGKEEGAKISIANNKQNKTDEIDLLALDERMEELQIKLDNEKGKEKWYLERQRRGWIELPKPTQRKYTTRRKLEKQLLIRRTIAYCIDLSKAMIDVPKLVSDKTGLMDSFYAQEVKDMLLSHIFATSIDEFKKKLDKDKKNELFIINLLGKQVVIYNLLSMIHGEIKKFPDEERKNIENNIIKIFDEMDNKKDGKVIPKTLLDIIDFAMKRFMKGFSFNKKEWYPTYTVEVVNEVTSEVTEEERRRDPTHKEIEDLLKGTKNSKVKHGLDANILKTILKDMEDNFDEDDGNKLKEYLEKFLPETVGDESDENGIDDEKDDSSSESKEEENNS